MTDYKKNKLSFDEAKKIIDEIELEDESDFFDCIKRWANFDVRGFDPIYDEIRDEIVSVFRQSLKNYDNKITYKLDLSVGIKLYELLNPENGFDIIAANDDDVWRYISVIVFPDLTFIRWPNRDKDLEILKEIIPGLSYDHTGTTSEEDSLRIKDQRFYSKTRRIWLKTLWWYIYLGWQGDSETTKKVLYNNGTNVISHLIERTGRNGYNVALYREMMYAFSLLPDQKDATFRAAAKLNLAKCVSVEPALTEGGVKMYSKDLFDEVYTKGAKNHEIEESNIEKLG